MQRQGRVAHAIHEQFGLLFCHEDVPSLFVLEILYVIGGEVDILVALPMGNV
jgi:hypothetical protein